MVLVMSGTNPESKTQYSGTAFLWQTGKLLWCPSQLKNFGKQKFCQITGVAG